ncbi:leucine-rich repeat flightless-interacting protein 1 isoform X5 [Cyrtonyx montezumae]|uniref:leucine-rich repeat flightless-interacting protein 1 isoform X5 n=1 Tax=Cyrtonyx montezumae TaxID=9017 RepID=UPI0032DA31D9
MGTQGACRKRLPNRERLTAEDDALNQIAREAEARLAAKRAARAEAREIRMKELERQQKEIYQVQKKYYGLDTKWGDIEQWMEDSERYSRRARRNASASDEDERMSVGSRGSLRSHLDYASTYPVAGLENERTKWKNYSKATNGYEEDVYGSSQSRKSSRPSEYSCYLSSGSRASSRASSARASPVIEERPEKDFEKGARTVSSLSAATLASLGGTSSRRGSVETSISADTETSIREIKDIYELKEQIQDVEGKYMQGLKEMKDSLAEVEEKYKKAMVSNAQLDNEKTNFMYQVDTLKDALLELEEQLAESRRQYEEKSKEFEREKHAHSILQFQFKEIKEALKQREEMLAEIQQLQQKQQSYVREISDLQETIEWKDKKIGALERQKDFFDSIRSERDDLRDEVLVLKEQLKKHGIIPDSDIATNGEASDALDSEGHLDSSKAVQGTTQALKTAGDGMLGRAKEVDMKNEILEDVGKGEMLQNSEREEHKEESEEQEAQTLRADENTEAEKMMEETDAVSTVTFPGSRFAEHTQSLTRPTAGNASSNDESDAGGLREEAESAGTAAQQPASREAERRDLAPGTTEKSEAGSLQGGDFDSPQETRTDLGTERELQAAAPEQEGEDEEPSHALSANGAGEAAGSASGSCEMGSGQSGLPQPELAGSLGEEVNGEGHTKMLQGSEGSAASEVPEVLEKGFVESRDCADGTGGDRAEEQNEVGSTDQGLEMERDSVGSEGEEWYESGAPSDTKEEGGGEEDLQEEVLTGNSEACSDAAEKQEKSSGECVGSVSRGGGSALQQTELDVDTVKATASQETSLDTDFSDDETEETEMQTGFASGEGKENSTGHLEQNRAGELEPKTELQALQCSEETTGDAVEEKSISAGGEAQSIVKQEEGESKEESVVYHSAASENQGDKEAFKETQLEPADRQGDGFTCEEDRTGSLARKAELDENVSEQLGPEGQAEEELEDDGDAFDFDDDSEQIEEADEKGDGEEVDAQCEEDGRANSAISNSAPAGGAGERTGETETSNTLTEGDSLQSEEGDGSEETGCLQEEAASVKSDGKAEVLEGENKASDSNEGEDVLGQDLGSAGSSRAESREDLRGGRKGKGKSRDDCTIS